jgi:cell division protease FtsH
MKNSWKHAWLGHLAVNKDKSSQNPKKSIPGRNLWRILGSLVISQGILLSTPVFAESTPNTMSYTQLIDNIEKGQVSSIEVDETQRTARVKLKNQKSDQANQLLSSTTTTENCTRKSAPKRLTLKSNKQPTTPPQSV